jgi:hypothetical protein
MGRLWMNKKAIVGYNEGAIGQKGYTLLYRQAVGCGASFCLRGKLDGTNGLVSGKTLDCIRLLKKPRDVG